MILWAKSIILRKKYDKRTTSARVADILMERKDERRNNLGHSLKNYGPDGEYGRWFEGESTLKSADVPLQILELEELNSDKHLRAIVLMVILYQTTQMMVFGDRNQKKPATSTRHGIYSAATKAPGPPNLSRPVIEGPENITAA